MGRLKSKCPRVRTTISLSWPNNEYVGKMVERGRFRSVSEYLNALLERERRENDEESLSEKVTATLMQFHHGIRQDFKILHQTTQTGVAYLQAAMKQLVVLLPDLDPDVKKLSVATAKIRCRKLEILASQELGQVRERVKESIYEESETE